jgi:hypothetical protein
MSNVLLVEPDYRSKFPPLGLLRIGAYHKARGDRVTFTRGMVEELRALPWHRIYVSSLFTYELPRTVKTIKYYRSAVDVPEHIMVGGIGATLLPDYIRERVPCRIITGPLSRPGILDGEKKPIADYTPDYSLIDACNGRYQPKDSYFCRVTAGCIRRCKFCAVPTLEPQFKSCQPLRAQIDAVDTAYGERQHLVILDNNILASKDFRRTVREIRDAGFEAGARRNGRQRVLDFNQGIDARLVTDEVAELLATTAVSPIRLAYDYSGMKKPYVAAIKRLARHGFQEFTNYVMFNFQDNPRDFYERIRLNVELSQELGIRITGFPMKYSPVTEVNRRYIAPGWKWRYLRGIQCVLLATHGLVSPNPVFFDAAFGPDYDRFLEIVSMPDRYIIYREKYKNAEAQDWHRLYHEIPMTSRGEFLDILAKLNRSRNKRESLQDTRGLRRILEHHYPGGRPTVCE